MEKSTIGAVIAKVLKKAGRPMDPKEIYDAIKRDNLYDFKAKHPEGIVRSQLRRHSENVSLPASSKIKYFIVLPDGKYRLID